MFAFEDPHTTAYVLMQDRAHDGIRMVAAWPTREAAIAALPSNAKPTTPGYWETDHIAYWIEAIAMFKLPDQTPATTSVLQRPTIYILLNDALGIHIASYGRTREAALRLLPAGVCETSTDCWETSESRYWLHTIEMPL